MIADYEHLLDLEFEAQGSKASVVLMPSGTPLYRREELHQAMQTARARLFAAVDELSPEQAVEYGRYRQAWIEERKQKHGR